MRWTRTQVYGLSMLVGVNLFNYLDRGIIFILQEPMKHELKLEDWQLGFLGGFAMSLLYTFSSLPFARLADRVNRIKLLSGALAVWSGLTALCGVTTSYLQLVFARVGVGAAEAACTPCTHSLISDTFTARQRGLAMSIMTTTIPIAQLIGPVIGGVVAMRYGWRAAYFVVGIPGIAFALLLYFTMREPRDPGTVNRTRPAWGSFVADMKLLFGDRAFTLLLVASAFMGQSLAGTGAFTASYFLRQFDMTLSQAGLIVGVGSGLAGVCGTFIGGWLADRHAGEYGRSYVYVCGVAALLAAGLYVVVFTRDSWQVALGFLLIANIATDLKNGPNMAAAQNMSPVHTRATAASLLVIFVVVLGTGLGPLIVGGLSDVLARRAFPVELGEFRQLCAGGRAAAGAAESLAHACRAASAAGLRGALLAPCSTFVIASIFFALSGRAIRRKLLL